MTGIGLVDSARDTLMLKVRLLNVLDLVLSLCLFSLFVKHHLLEVSLVDCISHIF